MNFLILTGMSGAGKSITIKFLEDIGFFCIDNLPPLLILRFAQACFDSNFNINKVALGIDIRGGKLFNDLFISLNNLYKEYEYKILFLDANDDVLIKRFKETRRVHPLAKNERIEYGIKKERELLNEVKNRSDYIIDTSYLLPRELKEQINNIFIKNKKFNNLIINILSFGFKHGLPDDADLVFDVRFVKNPYYISELKYKTGNDNEVIDYIFSYDISKDFLNKLFDIIKFLIPNYILEGKNQLVIAIGCTGGKHRSVAFANELYKYLKLKEEIVNINHLDINKDYGE